MEHSFDLTHVLYHLIVTAVFVVLFYTIIILMLRKALGASRLSGGKLKKVSGVSRQRRRWERAVSRHKRRK